MELKNFKNKIKKFIHKNILKRKYFRYGACARCGACCKNIYIRHDYKVIKTKEDFDKIKNSDSFYRGLEIIGSDDLGLTFRCTKYDEKNSKCTIHAQRPLICRKYPSEEIFLLGACLKEDCGYYFKPIESFKEVFTKALGKTLS